MTQTALFQTPEAPPPPPPWATVLPQWLQDQIPADTPRTGKTVNLQPCRKCGAITLHALDTATDYVTDTRADPALLTNDQEVQALLDGRTTHTLRLHLITEPELASRNRWAIQNQPSNTSAHPVVPDHRCNDPLGYPLPWETIYHRPKDTNGQPPF